MKRLINYIILISISLFAFYGCAGSMTPLSDEAELQKVIEVNNVSQDEIFIKSMEWFSRTFKESKSVIDYEDKEAGKIIGNGAVSHTYAMIVGGYVLFSVKIEAKDNRSRITLSNFRAKVVGTSGPPVTRAIMQSEYDSAVPKLEALMDEYGKYIQSASKSDDDW